MSVLVLKAIIILIVVKLSKKIYPISKINRILYIMTAIVVAFNFSDGMTFIIVAIITAMLMRKKR